MRSSSARWAALLVAAELLCPRDTYAYHDEATPSLEDSAYLLKSKEWLLGPLELGFAYWRLQLSTRTAPWLIGATLRKVTPNLELAALAFESERVTLSAGAALYYVNSRKLASKTPLVHLYLLPMQLALSVRAHRRHSFSVLAQYLKVMSNADATTDDVTLQGGALADNVHFQLSWEWRFTRVAALLVGLRYMPWQGTPIVHSTVTLDAQTSAEVDASVDVESLQHSVAGSVSGVFSWEHFNLRAGVGYGALFLDGPGLVLPLRWPYPELNLYWRL
jgi:hypothetical protein